MRVSVTGVNMTVKIAVEFSGGAELLFGKVRRHSLELEETNADGGKWTVRLLIAWIRDNLLKERPELFVQVRMPVHEVYALPFAMTHLHIVCIPVSTRCVSVTGPQLSRFRCINYGILIGTCLI